MKIPHATPAWFAMVGSSMQEAALRANLPADLHFSLVERYIGGGAAGAGLVQGLRFEIAGGQPSFRVGVRPDERADITVEVTAEASHALNTLRSADPAYAAALAAFQADGSLKMCGDLALLGKWFGEVHDRIVDRTR